MAEQFLNNPKLDPFEIQLASLAPHGSKIDRDRLMFAAGRQSVMQTETGNKKSLLFWRTASVLSACAAIVLAVMLANHPVERPEIIVGEEVAAKKSPTGSLVEKKKSIPQQIVQSEPSEPENRFSNWVLAFFDILPTEDEFPARRYDKLLEEQRYVSQRTEEDSVSSSPSQPPKTYLELMREFRQHTGDDRTSFFRSDNSLDLFGDGR